MIFLMHTGSDDHDHEQRQPQPGYTSTVAASFGSQRSPKQGYYRPNLFI